MAIKCCKEWNACTIKYKDYTKKYMLFKTSYLRKGLYFMVF